MPLKKKSQNRKGKERNHSIWYEIVMGIELVLYAGFVVFVAAKIVPTDFSTFVGIIAAGLIGYVLWVTKMEVIDLLIKIPLWVHWFAVFTMTCILVTGSLLVSKLSTSPPTNATK